MIDTEQAKEMTNAIIEYWNKNPHLTIQDILDMIQTNLIESLQGK